MAAYQCLWVAALEKQLLLSPPPVRRRQADRLEAFLLSLNPEAVYSYEFVYFRVTGFRPAGPPIETGPGRLLRRDLLRLLERITKSAPAEAALVAEKVFTVEELAGRLDVSPRTVLRWRDHGLISRKYRFPDGKLRVGVRESLLRRFADEHGGILERAGRFSRLTDTERHALAREARQLAQHEGLSPTAAAARVAAQAGRAKETVRQALLREQEEATVGGTPGVSPGRLSPAEKQRIYAAYCAGQSANALCHSFHRSRASIYRVLNEARARALLADTSVPEDFLAEEAFRRPDVEKELWAAGLPQPIAPAEQEALLFRRYSYLRYALALLKGRVTLKRYVPSALLDDIELHMLAAQAVREHLLTANFPLLADVARNHVSELVRLPELVSDGGRHLLGVIDRFDYRRGGRFAPLARLELMKHFARTTPPGNYGPRARAGPQRQGLPSGGSPPLPQQECLAALQALADLVARLRSTTSARHKETLLSRFGLRPAPLAEVLAPAASALGLGESAGLLAATRAQESGGPPAVS